MSQVEQMMADAGSPASTRDGATALVNGMAIIAPTGSTQWLNTPPDWLGAYVRFTFIGAGATDVCYVRFSATTAPTIDQSTATTIASNVLAQSAVEPHLVLPSGVPIDERIDKRHMFFAYIASATSGKLYVQLKTGIAISTGATPSI